MSPLLINHPEAPNVTWVRLGCGCMAPFAHWEPGDPGSEHECPTHGTMQLHVALQATLYKMMDMIGEEEE